MPSANTDKTLLSLQVRTCCLFISSVEDTGETQTFPFIVPVFHQLLSAAKADVKVRIVAAHIWFPVDFDKSFSPKSLILSCQYFKEQLITLTCTMLEEKSAPPFFIDFSVDNGR